MIVRAIAIHSTIRRPHEQRAIQAEGHQRFRRYPYSVATRNHLYASSSRRARRGSDCRTLSAARYRANDGTEHRATTDVFRGPSIPADPVTPA